MEVNVSCFRWFKFGRSKGRRVKRDKESHQKKVPVLDAPKTRVTLDADAEHHDLPSYQECLNEDESDLAYRPEVLETIRKTIDDLSRELRTLSVQIHGSLDKIFIIV